jgi:hypothetical protein
MAYLFSQYRSGLQFTAGTITGSILGTSGLNPIVDRLNSIALSDNLITGSMVSGTNTNIYASGMQLKGNLSGTNIDIYVSDVFTNGRVSGTSLLLYASGGNLTGGKTSISPLYINVGSSPVGRYYNYITHFVTLGEVWELSLPLNIPNGAKINQIMLDGYSGNTAITFGVRRAEIGNPGTYIASGTATFPGGSIVNPGLGSVIDNTNYHYFIYFTPTTIGSNFQFAGGYVDHS